MLYRVSCLYGLPSKAASVGASIGHAAVLLSSKQLPQVSQLWTGSRQSLTPEPTEMGMLTEQGKPFPTISHQYSTSDKLHLSWHCSDSTQVWQLTEHLMLRAVAWQQSLPSEVQLTNIPECSTYTDMIRGCLVTTVCLHLELHSFYIFIFLPISTEDTHFVRIMRCQHLASFIGRH